jgi:membrane-associated phospholipid phosphatase
MSGTAYTAPAPSRLARRDTGAARALGIALLCLLGLVLVWLTAELVPAARVRDASALHDFTQLSTPHVARIAEFALHLVDPVMLIFWGAALVLVALARGRGREALAVSAVIALAPLSADRLKPLLAHPHTSVGEVHIGAASWPSGHSTAALALALCAVLVAAPRLRPLVALGGAAFALAVGASLLIQAWHMPSDVLGGYLMAALWAAVALTVLRAAERRWPREDRSPAPRSGPARATS